MEKGRKVYKIPVLVNGTEEISMISMIETDIQINTDVYVHYPAAPMEGLRARTPNRDKCTFLSPGAAELIA